MPTSQPDLAREFRRVITDAYYEERNDPAGTMESAADRARDAAMDLIRSTPLPAILDALGHTYRAGWGLFYDQPETEWSASPHRHENDVPVLVVDNPATDEVHDA